MITPLFYIAVAKCSLCFFVAESPQLIRPYSDLKQSKNTVQYKIFGMGKTQGLSALAEGMDADELIKKLSGIRCGFKGTSCPDQLTKAVAEAKK